MSTTLLSGTVDITITEVVRGSQNYVQVNKRSLTSVSGIDHRVMTVTAAAPATIMNFGTTAAAGTYIRTLVLYARITNLDDTNALRLRCTKSSGATFDVQVDAGGHFLLCNTHLSASTTAAAFSAFADMDSIVAQAITADTDIDLFIALSAPALT